LLCHLSYDVFHLCLSGTTYVVIGELKKGPKNDKSILLQLAVYAREVFASQPTRRFVHGFILQATKMQPWVFDRSGPFPSQEFDIHNHPEWFVRVMVGYLMMSEAELGFDTFIERRGSKQFINTKAARTRRKRGLELKTEPITFQRAIVCRGTGCFRAKPTTSKSWQYVVKFNGVQISDHQREFYSN
jgi:Fungal protein kinase